MSLLLRLLVLGMCCINDFNSINSDNSSVSIERQSLPFTSTMTSPSFIPAAEASLPD